MIVVGQSLDCTRLRHVEVPVLVSAFLEAFPANIGETLQRRTANLCLFCQIQTSFNRLRVGSGWTFSSAYYGARGESRANDNSMLATADASANRAAELKAILVLFYL